MPENSRSLSSSQPALLSVVIPNWNGLHFLETCLESLRAQRYDALEIILVDNASQDGSQAYVRDQYPEVTLILLPENRGFTGACNAGMQAAHGTYIALLNNDTELDPGWAAAVVDAFQRHPQVGMVASKMLLFDQRDHIHTAGDYFTLDGQAGNRGVWQRDVGQYDSEEYVFSACGGASIYRADMLAQVGLLDDDFFFLLEDMDLGWRAQLAGWRCLYTPQAVVYHHLSATGGGVTASYYAGRNSIILLAKNYPEALWRRHGRQVLRTQLRSIIEALRSWRGEASRARLRGVLAGLRMLPNALNKRRAIQNSRRITIDDLERALSPAQDAD